jgi:hypothetical protein
MDVRNSNAKLLGIFGLICVATVTGCNSTHKQHATAAPVSAKPLELVTLGAGDQLGVSLYQHYVMVATLRGETKTVALTSAR